MGSCILRRFTRKFNEYGQKDMVGLWNMVGQISTLKTRYSYCDRDVDRVDLISDIHSLLRVHKIKRERTTGLFMCSNEFHNSIKKVIRLCYEYKIGPSCLYPVGELLFELYVCTGNSEWLFSALQFQSSPDKILYPSKRDSDIHDAFNYYIQHACNIHTSGRSQPVDLLNCVIDSNSGLYNIMPLSMAIQTRNISYIHSLLKYGADPLTLVSVKDNSSCSQIMCPTQLVLDELNGVYMFLKQTQFNQETKERLIQQEAKLYDCLDIIRRAVPNIPLHASTHISTYQEDCDADDDSENETYIEMPQYSIHPKLADVINLEFFRLGSLKHLCRCIIRQRLKSNKKTVATIPKGVSLLPLPNILKSYVNLEVW